ncbi:hypothetical protein PHLGIDRAFT_126174 [Phlebiopsis gigantea 11061_1 CR5-6]|uniref:tRNA (guanine(26)-N(2))-dimethyltransferase n=1 Tax=Phlebiopsis gigantea (strain 11061_1 CR5-6) TaxID=745531 RepID=A0A0C3SAX7_PHLG1|nr:hypothetical protein PHLGIDRAFT_126174 [Phlebiopsis gigantea 11061_1 CR5-6]
MPPADPPPDLIVPDGYTLHSENTSHILLPSDNGAFLNPVQEFNRDLSVACIRVWGEQMDETKKLKWEQERERKAQKAESKAKKQKLDDGKEREVEELATEGSEQVVEAAKPKLEYRPSQFVILEALSATGLRSVRYAKEIPQVKYVIANDLSDLACEAMRRNVELNDLHAKEDITEEGSSTQIRREAKVRVNEGDACALMYNHRTSKNRVDVVDLDPYGTAAPFIDAAVQCVNDGGLLCVTCTDLQVLATTNYPEKCFANYGGLPLKGEYCHESALRLVLHSLATSAARYGRYIEPLASLSIDFYVRLFVRVKTSQAEVKKLVANTASYYVCSGCQSFYEQSLGKVKTSVSAKTGDTNYHYKVNTGPPVSDKCPECNSIFHLAGPMWSGPLHDKNFIGKVLDHVEANSDKYGTSPRMKGMLTVAKEELDSVFFFSPGHLAGTFHCIAPSLHDVTSALLHAGHTVSRSHAVAGSLKTDAPRSAIYSIFRSWIKNNPVKMEKISQTSPSRVLIEKEPAFEANFKHHPGATTKSSAVKLVRYQQNPLPNWGPGSRAVSGTKRKRPADA